MRLAVLFGSVAVGRESAGSDVDLLVALRGALAVATLAQRLSDRLGREVQLVRLEEAERSPILMVRRPRSRAGSWSTATRRGPG